MSITPESKRQIGHDPADHRLAGQLVRKGGIGMDERARGTEAEQATLAVVVGADTRLRQCPGDLPCLVGRYDLACVARCSCSSKRLPTISRAGDGRVDQSGSPRSCTTIMRDGTNGEISGCTYELLDSLHAVGSRKNATSSMTSISCSAVAAEILSKSRETPTSDRQPGRGGTPSLLPRGAA